MPQSQQRTATAGAPARGLRSDRLLILDFGGQYTQLIARNIRECGVYCEIYPWDADAAAIEKFAASGFILSGGPETVTSDETPRAPDTVFAAGVPVLGICYGMQTMAAQLGGEVESSSAREFGFARVRLERASTLLDGLTDCVVDAASDGAGEAGIAATETIHEPQDSLEVWMSHGDRVVWSTPRRMAQAKQASPRRRLFTNRKTALRCG